MIPINTGNLDWLKGFIETTDGKTLVIVLLVIWVVYLLKMLNNRDNTIKQLQEDVRNEKNEFWKLLMQKEPMLREAEDETPRHANRKGRKTGTESSGTRTQRTPRNERSVPKKRPE